MPGLLSISHCRAGDTAGFNGHFSTKSPVSWFQNSASLEFTGAEVDGGGGDNWSVQSCQIVTISKSTATQRFTDRMPFLSANQ